MLFPDAKRVIYKVNPLEQVICQLRFPPILRIDTGPPSEFQDKIRVEFPEYSEIEERASTIETPPTREPYIVSTSTNKNYQFLKVNGTSQINLTRTSIAYSTREYIRWEEFKKTIVEIEKHFREIYIPSYYVRMGLRYIDVIKRSKLGLVDIPWHELLISAITGLLDADDIVASVRSLGTMCLLALPEYDASVRFNIGIFTDNIQEECFSIDVDFFTGKRCSPDKYLDQLEYLHEEAHRCIRWCIKDRLHEAMKPGVI